MASTQEVLLRISGDSVGGRRALKDIDGALDSTHAGTGRLGSGFRRMGEIGKTALVGVGVAAAAAVAGVVAYMVSVGRDLADKQRLLKQTEAVLASTGNAANVTASHVVELADSLEKMSGVDDQAIQSGQNMLLTFTNIRNEAGEGNDIFDQASTAMLDMSVAMNNGDVSAESLKNTSIQLGKALQDPVEGAAALKRVGVQLTDQQEAQIKTMVESGDVMGAQKVILGELQRQFGGSAKALGESQPWNIFMAYVHDAAEGLENGLLPALNNAFGWLNETGVPALQNAAKSVEEFIDSWKYLGFVATVQQFFGDGSWVTGTVDAFAGLKDRIVELWNHPAVQKVLGQVWDNLKASWDQLKQAGQQLKPTFEAMKPWLERVGMILGGAFLVAILLVSSGLRAIAAIINYVVMPAIRIVGAILSWWTGLMFSVAGAVFGAIGAIVGVFSGLPGRIIGVIHAAAGLIYGVGSWVIDRIVAGVTAVLGWVSGAAGQVKDTVINTIMGFGENLKSIGSWILERIKDGITGAIGFITEAAGWIKDRIVESIKSLFGISSPSTVMMELGENMIRGLVMGMQVIDPMSVVNNFLGGAWNVIKSAPQMFGGLFSNLGSIFGGGGAESWRPVVEMALRLLGYPLAWADLTVAQINSESGGNPMAINLDDINAQRGDPSMGLLQNIGSAYRSRLPDWYLAANPGTTAFDPLGSIMAGLRYMVDRYGSPYGVWGEGHGYAGGGWAGLKGPELAWLGEKEPELVIPRSRIGSSTAAPGSVQVNLHFDKGMEWLKNFIRVEVDGKAQAAINANRSRV